MSQENSNNIATGYLNTQDVMQQARVFCLKSFQLLFFCFCYSHNLTSKDMDIIYILDEHYKPYFFLSYKYIMIRVGFKESKGEKHITQFIKPCVMRLFQPINCFFQVTYQFSFSLSNKPKWLLYIYLSTFLISNWQRGQPRLTTRR